MHEKWDEGSKDRVGWSGEGRGSVVEVEYRESGDSNKIM